ncbi:MAG: polyphosphate polymerase domain-containing protein [Firmicutes bacterium]|nr:polyphosphate polymerase domain-containing protein [Bacillota bacterium]
MKQKPHFRHELKYDITFAEYLQLLPRLKAVMQRDPHAGEGGRYRIHSIYFDNFTDKAVREKLSGVSRREKFRLRWYNDDFSVIKLEKKMKENSLCQKFSAPLTESEFQTILRGDIAWMKDHGNTLIRELYLKEQTQLLRPKVCVSYLREPFIYAPGNVRVTFDSDLRSSLYHPFCAGDYLTDIDIRMEPGHMIMEVKYDAFLPEIIDMLLQIGRPRQTAFSKYVVCRRFG